MGELALQAFLVICCVLAALLMLASCGADTEYRQASNYHLSGQVAGQTVDLVVDGTTQGQSQTRLVVDGGILGGLSNVLLGGGVVGTLAAGAAAWLHRRDSNEAWDVIKKQQGVTNADNIK